VETTMSLCTKISSALLVYVGLISPAPHRNL
jgi:hypothetical protein